MYLTGMTQLALRHEARESAPREVCGFVTLDGDTHQIDNINQNDGEWKMDVEQSIEFRRSHVGQIVGTYHTHPKGSLAPSVKDRSYCPVSYLMWIVTVDGVWRWMRYDEGVWVGINESTISTVGLLGDPDWLRSANPEVAVISPGRRGHSFATIEGFDKAGYGDRTLASYISEEGHPHPS